MSKVTLDTLATLEDDASAVDTLNDNFGVIQEAFDNTLSRDGSTPNTMAANIDMDGYRVTNLPDPESDSEAATKGYVDAVNPDGADLAAAVLAAAASATAAAASAVTAASEAEALLATSTTNLTPAVASKAWTIEADKAYTVGMFVFAVSDADPTNWAAGQVTDYTGTTLTVDVQSVGAGAAAAADWSISVSGPIGASGADGAAGAAGADYTADDELNALAGLTATTGLLTQTADNVFTTRNIAGTANRITVTNPAGVAGDPTLDVGTDVLVKGTTKTLTVGFTHTVYDHGTKSGTASIDPLPSLSLLQKASLSAAATITVNAPSEEGTLILQLTNAGAPTSVTFSGFDKTLLGDSFSLTINKVHWIYIWSIGTMQVMQIVNVA